MGKAKEKALEAYPVLFSERLKLDKTMADRRLAYEYGYKQAEDDLKIFACNWLSNNFWNYYDKETKYVNLSGLIYELRVAFYQLETEKNS